MIDSKTMQENLNSHVTLEQELWAVDILGTFDSVHSCQLLLLHESSPVAVQ